MTVSLQNYHRQDQRHIQRWSAPESNQKWPGEVAFSRENLLDGTDTGTWRKTNVSGSK